MSAGTTRGIQSLDRFRGRKWSRREVVDERAYARAPQVFPSLCSAELKRAVAPR